MSSSQKNAGYDQEEKYFHDLNQKLIKGLKQGKAKAPQNGQPGKLISFPVTTAGVKKAG